MSVYVCVWRHTTNTYYHFTCPIHTTNTYYQHILLTHMCVCVCMARVVVCVSVCVIARARVCVTHTESFLPNSGSLTHPRPPHMALSRVHPPRGATVTVMVVGGVVQILRLRCEQHHLQPEQHHHHHDCQSLPPPSPPPPPVTYTTHTTPKP